MKAIIFDMDGLLVNSEPLWQKAEMEVFGEAGVPLTPAHCQETTGLRIDQVVEHWRRRFGFEGLSPAEVKRGVLDRVGQLVAEQAEPMPGALQAVASAPRPVALASSSPRAIIDAVLSRFEIRDRFTVICSADEETDGKPHPAVFLTTAERLEVEPVDCLVFEDSLNGVLAAKAARMRCVAVPEAPQRSDPRYVIADRVLDSLLDLDAEAWQDLLQ